MDQSVLQVCPEVFARLFFVLLEHELDQMVKRHRALPAFQEEKSEVFGALGLGKTGESRPPADFGLPDALAAVLFSDASLNLLEP